MAESIKQCTGDCLKCSFQQQTYCSAQRNYAMMGILANIQNSLEEIKKELSSNEVLINPFLQEKAQEERGAENSSLENNNS